MAISSLSRVINKGFLTNLFAGGQSSSSRSSSSSSSSSTDAVFKSPSLLKDGLRNGARIFGEAIQNLNVATSFLGATKDTLENLVDVVDKVISLAETASQSRVGSAQRANIDSEFRRLGTKFKKIVSEATGTKVSVLSETDLQTALVSVGLDAESSESVAKIFKQFEFSDDDQIGSDTAQATRPVRYAKDVRYVAEGTLQAAVTFSTPGFATTAQSGDFTNDGKPDVIAHATSLELLVGNGNGTFASAVTIATGGNGGLLAVGDFNRDGNLDVFDSPSATSAIRLSLGNGNGTFSTGTTLTAVAPTDFLRTADLTGDGVLDLVAGVRAGSGVSSLSIFVGNGNGTFKARTTLATTSEPLGITIADIDRDGLQDIVALDAGSPTISFFKGNGNGTFAAAITKATGTTGPFFGYAIQSADVNLDGNQDLITSGYSQPTINIFLGNGNGTFGTRTSYTITGTEAFGFGVADLTGDGIVDIAAGSTSGGDVAGSGRLTILKGAGNGTFSTFQTFTSVGGANIFPSVADFTGDGVDDISYSHSGGLSGFSLLRSNSIETTNRAPKSYSSLFDSSRIINSRSEAFGLLADAKAVKAELQNNLKAVNAGLSLVETNINFSRQAGLKLFDLSNNLSTASDADTVVNAVVSAIRSRVPGAVEQAENLDPIVVAALLNNSKR